MTPPSADPQIGRVLAGQFRIEALLGQGGMGCVYKGVQLSVNRAVAIKLITASAPNQDELVRRFRREAEATARLSHPNSVRLFDFGVTDKQELYMVMELLSGSDLSAHLKECGSLPLQGALQIARQVLQALAEAHAVGIVHRDLKPGNVFLSRVQGGEIFVKVMDFGIAGIEAARETEKLTLTGAVMGTPAYMSPEQAQGQAVDARSDLYSLGVMLFEMLTGRLPFEADTMVSLLLAHVTQPPPRLNDVAPSLPQLEPVQGLLDRLLAKQPDQRPPTAAAALELIDAFLAGVPLPPSARNQVTPLRTAAITPNAQTETPLGWTVNRRRISVGARLRNAALIAAGLLLSAALLIWQLDPTAAPKRQPPPVATPDPASTLYIVNIASAPSGANVQLEGAELGKTPYTLKFRRTTQVQLSLEGYEPKLLSVGQDSEPNQVVDLVKLEPAAPSGGDTPSADALPAEALQDVPPRAEEDAKAPKGKAAKGKRRGGSARADANPSGQDEPAQTPSVPSANEPATQQKSGFHSVGDLFGRGEQRARREQLLRGAPPYPSVAAAQRAYRAGSVTPEAYEDAIWVLKMKREQRIQAEKQNLKERTITAQEYEWRLGRIDAEFRGE